MTSEEAEYLEKLGFVPSAFSMSTFVLTGTNEYGSAVIRAVIERVPYTHATGTTWTTSYQWRARRSGIAKPATGDWAAPDAVESNDLISLVVLAKLEGIL